MSTDQFPSQRPDTPFLSVIIPAYNEESRIVGTLREVVDYLALQPYSWEVVVVDDGSADRTPGTGKVLCQCRIWRVSH